MARRASRRKAQAPAGGRPSLFFIIAIAVGVAMIAWLYFQSLSNPQTPPPPPAATSTAPQS